MASNHRKCCCTPACEDCGEDATPPAYVATFADVVLYPDCLQCTTSDPSLQGQMRYISGTLDGTYTLDQDPTNPCRWFTTITLTTHEWHNSSFGHDCTNPPTVETTTFYIELYRGAGFFNVIVSASPGGGSPSLFTATLTGDCTDPGSGANDWTSAACAVSGTGTTLGNLGYDGTVTVTLPP